MIEASQLATLVAGAKSEADRVWVCRGECHCLLAARYRLRGRDVWVSIHREKDKAQAAFEPLGQVEVRCRHGRSNIDVHADYARLLAK